MTKQSAARLQTRPMPPTKAGSLGLHTLQFESQRDGLLYVPATYRADHPAPFVMMLHGASGNAEGGLSLIQEWADAFDTIVLAVDSRQYTWDAIVSHYGSDIAVIDRALAETFDHYAIDSNHIAIAGFSDGASYALAVGVTNGDLFTHILAFSPGFIAPAARIGQPRCFISHGKRDMVLPIDRCSHRIVAQLQQAGYDVLYREFEEGHTVPVAIAREGTHWITA